MRRDEEGQMEWSGAGQGRANTERESIPNTGRSPLMTEIGNLL